jgi:choline-sulfatase
MIRSMYRLLTLMVALVLVPIAANGTERDESKVRPNVLIVSIDTLRADHVSAYGYSRATTPNLDALISDGIRFDRARTIEPLTGPALVSLLTSIHPHEHGASRNGLRMRTGLASLPKAMQAHGYRTVAYVGNWTLRDKLSGLAEHFDSYNEILTRNRWWGLVRREADAEDLTDSAIDWLESNSGKRSIQPFFMWVHYVEPHAPYRLHSDYLEQLGLDADGNQSAENRYDTEIAFVDASIGRLLDHMNDVKLDEDTIVVFLSDHGESLGEHGYWGHGRNLYEPTLRIPMSITWKGQLRPTSIEAPSLIIDLAPTILGMLDEEGPSTFEGFDWTGVFSGDAAPMDRQTLYQAHRGAVMSKHESDLARRSGLLEVGVIHDEKKEVFHVGKSRRQFYDLTTDPLELADLSEKKEAPTEGLMTWMQTVFDGLIAVEDSPPEPLDEESVEVLRSLGYVD